MKKIFELQRYAQYILDHRQKYFPMENIMDVLIIAWKGKMFNNFKKNSTSMKLAKS